ncbi:hypothetical protein QUC32_23140 [Novosphingobium resinovorum]|uniref:hypothetical protein n=1 Tax=Novosphingobium TaxID=165696 RepID=UPI001B3C733D|nr:MULTISPECIES: hypothetical protein [Novosphingobium]MBF7012547.1 hypothetical protein [Novosphingobium sp. HR1a]WJM27281.1 hypothetical protein QUC32_23140 [Novosphingobium resinovorum]
MSRASGDVLDMLHALVAGSLSDELARAAQRAALPRDDENYAPLNPQLIDKALKFLKDNGVDAPAKSARVDTLAATLGELDLDDVGHEIRTSH